MSVPKEALDYKQILSLSALNKNGDRFKGSYSSIPSTPTAQTKESLDFIWHVAQLDEFQLDIQIQFTSLQERMQPAQLEVKVL